jgi:hypothetical protein
VFYQLLYILCGNVGDAQAVDLWNMVLFWNDHSISKYIFLHIVSFVVDIVISEDPEQYQSIVYL